MSYSPTAKFVTLDADGARSIVGFRTELQEGEKGISAFLDGNNVRQKFVLDKNKANRPLSMSVVKRYQDVVFEGLFAGQHNSPASTTTGEPLIVDGNGNVTSAAHRCVALILAQAEADRLRNLGQTEILEELNVPEKITMPILLVEGIDPLAADMVDTGKVRSLGDVYFRRTTFKNGKDITDAQKVVLTRQLALACRLVWLRLRGEQLNRGGKFSFPEALAFSDQHSLLVDALLHVFTENGGEGKGGKLISGYIDLGYAAGMMYLMGWSGNDRSGLEDGSTRLDRSPKLWATAEKFWTLFAGFSKRAVKMDDAPSIGALNKILEENSKSQKKMARDEVCALVARAWLGFAGTDEEKKAYSTAKGLKNKLFVKVGTGDAAKEVLNLTRVGGFDLDKEVLIENGWIRKEEKVTRKTMGEWKVGDTVWVDQPKLDPWFGKIVLFNLKGNRALVESKETQDVAEADQDISQGAWAGIGIMIKKGQQMIFEVDTAWLKANRPERKPEAPPAPVAASAPMKKPPVPAVAK